MRLPPETWLWAVARRSCTRRRSASTWRWDMPRGDAHGYSPTRPVRLMSVSSISSIVDIARAEAW